MISFMIMFEYTDLCLIFNKMLQNYNAHQKWSVLWTLQKLKLVID